MPWVQREAGPGTKVVGKFATQQPGIADEFLTDGHADLTPSLADYKVTKKGVLRLQMLGYINASWDAAQQMGFLMVMCKGLNNGLTNRKAKVQAVFDWGENVMGEYYTCCDNVDAAATHAGVDAVAPNYAQFVPPDQTVRDAKETTT